MMRLDRPNRLEAIDIVVADRPPAIDTATRTAIEVHWREAREANPALWNGSAFLFEAVEIRDGRFSALARPTDYATLLYRLRVGFDRPATLHVFPVAALTSRDGRLLVGRQSATTANAGLAYPPSGSFDAGDVVDGRLDPVANMRRELEEEVGLDLDAYPGDPHWWAIPSGTGRIALVRRHRCELSASALLAEAVRRRATAREDEVDALELVDRGRLLAGLATVPYVPLLLDLIAAERRASETTP